ncbi:MAG: cytochrome c oxidase subunit 3 family protein [Acidobacteria bacterium]|nr:cytochrome c oxidase subunit 3 family protein [Acidobacteriota bacterium]
MFRRRKLSDTTTAEAQEHRFLQHHFEDLFQQHESSTLGMWFFMAQEILFFGGLLAAYVVYRLNYYDAFIAASQHQDLVLGTTNTAVLILSSLTMALAVRSAQLARRKAIIGFLILTMLLGGVFVGIKAVEYYDHWEHHLVPGPAFEFHDPLPSDVLPQTVEMFYVLYFGLTGLHALHMVIGMGLVAWIAWRAHRNHFTPDYFGPVEVVGLYWHFVDIVWIFLFPLLYLIGRHPQ